MNATNVITHDIDLNNAVVSLPKNCTLFFIRGSISNGALVFNRTYLKGNVCINAIVHGEVKNHTLFAKWFSK